jgi:ketose-bisphosphate aldolase
MHLSYYLSFYYQKTFDFIKKCLYIMHMVNIKDQYDYKRTNEVRMKFIPIKALLQHAYQNNYAVPSFCVWNAEAMVAVLRAADKLNAPVILMNGPAEFGYLRPAQLLEMARVFAKKLSIPIAFHLDHGDSPELVDECLSAGYSSVMLDYSNRPLVENRDALKKVAERAHPMGVSVEGELGHVGKADTMTMEGDGDSTLTKPDEAAAFVKETGVDALAVSIGNAHGQYTRLPRLDFGRLAEIRAAVSVPLVLHGGSGTPEPDLKRAIGLGIAKINVATDLVTAWRETQKEQWNAGRNLWAPQAQAESGRAVEAVVEKWIIKSGAAGKARETGNKDA